MQQIFNTNELQKTSPVVAPLPVLDAGKARVLILSLSAGQAVDPCQMSFLVLYYFIEGQGQIQIDDRLNDFSPGTLASVPADITRSIHADSPTRVLLVQIP